MRPAASAVAEDRAPQRPVYTRLRMGRCTRAGRRWRRCCRRRRRRLLGVRARRPRSRARRSALRVAQEELPAPARSTPRSNAFLGARQRPRAPRRSDSRRTLASAGREHQHRPLPQSSVPDHAIASLTVHISAVIGHSRRRRLPALHCLARSCTVAARCCAHGQLRAYGMPGAYPVQSDRLRLVSSTSQTVARSAANRPQTISFQTRAVLS